jgi:uncharacterized membrane protein
MPDDKDKKKGPSASQIVSAALGGSGIQGMNSDKVKSIIILIGFILALVFFVFPFILGLGSEFFAGGIGWIPSIIGLIMAYSVIYIGGIK